MMKRLLFGAIAATGLVILPACSDTFNPTSDCEGRILPTVGVDPSVAAPSAPAKAASRASGQALEISANDLTLKLSANDGSLERSWASLTEFNTAENFPVGAYTFEVSYGDPKFGGFNKPYYFGSTPLTVLENKTTPVNITAKLCNAMVTVRYSEAMNQYFTEYSGEVTAGTSSYVYSPEEMRTLYVVPGRVSLNINVTKPNGVTGKLNAIDFQAEAAHHYVIDVTVNNGNVGGGALNVTFNSDVVEETVDLDISDQVLSADAPVISPIGFSPGEPIDIIEGVQLSDLVRMSITAAGYVETATLTVSQSLVARGWPETVDLATADENTLLQLRNFGMGMVGFDGIKSQMAFVGFNRIPRYLQYLDGGDNTVSFTLVAKDRNSKLSSPLTLTYNITKMDLRLENIHPLMVDETKLNFDLIYSGNIENVVFERKNEQGIFRPVANTSIEHDETDQKRYHVSISVPADELNVRLRANSNDNMYSDEYVIVRKGVATTLSDLNVFATKATLSVRCGEDPTTHPHESTVLLSTNGTDYDEYTNVIANGTDLTLTGLTPSTQYYVKVQAHEGESKPIMFTTEAATQLQNSGMEEWFKGNSGRNWSCMYPGTSTETQWGTSNPMTTSQGGDFAYCKISGTIDSTDKYPQSTGSKAALLRTIGWGSGNVALGSISESNPKYVDVGLLHLGSTQSVRDEELSEGIDFASRPTNLTFFYKYIPKNNADYGAVEVWVKDASGNIIAQGSKQLAETSYNRTVIPLQYKPNSPKAAKIYVRFVSSANPACLVRTTDNFSVPKFMVGGSFVGSQLLIDDISLTY